MQKIKNILLFITNLFFPHTCLVCNKIVSHLHYTGICLECYKKFELFNIAYHPELEIFLKSSDIDSFNSPFIYSDEIAKIILEFKFYDKEEKGVIISNLLNASLRQIENYENCLLVPVPIHKKRLLNRKYNQSSVLVKTIAKKNKLHYSNNALKRIKNTPHQTGQSKAKRVRQLKNSFLADNSIVKNRDIILIDDVFTTGSTANLCAKELKKQGAKKVHVLTIAYTPL